MSFAMNNVNEKLKLDVKRTKAGESAKLAPAFFVFMRGCIRAKDIAGCD